MRDKKKQAKYNKLYWKRNSERIIKKRQLNGYYRDYYKRTPSWKEKMNIYRRNWKISNSEEAKKRGKEAMARWKLTPLYRYQSIKRNAKKKNRMTPNKIEFLNWFSEQVKNCYYCGVSEELSKKVKNKILEIDRKNNDEGYIISNMVLACYLCNGVKSNLLTEQETIFVGQNLIKEKWKNLE